MSLFIILLSGGEFGITILCVFFGDEKMGCWGWIVRWRGFCWWSGVGMSCEEDAVGFWYALLLKITLLVMIAACGANHTRHKACQVFPPLAARNKALQYYCPIKQKVHDSNFFFSRVISNWKIITPVGYQCPICASGTRALIKLRLIFCEREKNCPNLGGFSPRPCTFINCIW